MGKIGVGLVGVGRIGRLHAANLAAHNRFCLLAVADVNSDAAATVAAECGVAVAESAEAMFADERIAAVMVATATATHCDFIEGAVAAGKAVLCEKPLDLNEVRVRRTAEFLRGYPDAVVQIGFNRRFDPGHAAVMARVAAGEIGALEKLIITSRDPGLPSTEYLAASGGLFHDMMIHDFDMARAILPQEPCRLSAAAAALVSAPVCRAAGGDVDTAMVTMQTAGGVLCHINCSRRTVYGYDQRIEAFGSDGMLISNNHTQTQVQAHSKNSTAAYPPLQHFFTERYAQSYRRQLDAFADAVTGAVPAAPNFDDGARALQLAIAAKRALDDGAWVELPAGATT